MLNIFLPSVQEKASQSRRAILKIFLASVPMLKGVRWAQNYEI